MRKKHKSKIIWGIVIIGLVGLMIWGSQSSQADTWSDTEVACLPGGHQNAMLHIHANLSVTVDGQAQSVPGNVGIDNTCMAETHTHNAGGEIHIESPNQNADQTLADFFTVWDQPLEREGYERTILVNGVESSPEYVFSDGDQIEVRFNSINATEDGATSTTATSSEDEATSTNSTSSAS